jgi:hypothetical protein
MPNPFGLHISLPVSVTLAVKLFKLVPMICVLPLSAAAHTPKSSRWGVTTRVKWTAGLYSGEDSKKGVRVGQRFGKRKCGRIGLDIWCGRVDPGHEAPGSRFNGYNHFHQELCARRRHATIIWARPPKKEAEVTKLDAPGPGTPKALGHGPQTVVDRSQPSTSPRVAKSTMRLRISSKVPNAIVASVVTLVRRTRTRRVPKLRCKPR